MATRNQTPEQKARDHIDAMLEQAGWRVQAKKKIDFNAGPGIAVREYDTDVGPADYVLFVNKRAVGVIEAKPENWGQKITTVEDQSQGYAAAELKWVKNNAPLPFVYESTGVITRFTDGHDPKPRSREVFTFHRPETLQEWLTKPASLRGRLHKLPVLDPSGLRDCQIKAIEKLEASFKDNRPRALIQMATGSGKTYAAITSIYRLLKHADAKRILFLVDTKNLGEQAEQEFMAYLPTDDNRKFTELYNVQRLKSSFVAKDSQVCISTIQRMYSLLKGQELDEATEEINPAEMVRPKQPMPVVYNAKIPIEFFDFIVIDECHRSIYNLWRQVIEYFDAYLIGLTATPDQRTYGFFQKNVVSEYDHERAVADGVNVGNEIYLIETQRSLQGGILKAEQVVEKRERLTRKRRWERQDEEEAYSAKQLDRDIVNPDQIRTVIQAFRDRLPEIFPGRKEVPKTLIFAKIDSQPLITKPTVPLKDLAMGVMMGARDEDTVSSLAGRLARLNKQLDEHDQQRIREKAGGVTLTQVVGNLLDAIDPDRVQTRACEIAQQPADSNPGDDARRKARDEMVGQAANVFTGELVELLDGIRRDKEQTLDHENLDTLQRAEWAGDAEDNAKQMVKHFSAYLEANRNEIEALNIFYQTPQRRSELTYDMIRGVFDILKTDRPRLAPLRIWQAYAYLDHDRHSRESGNPVSELTALVALIRRTCGIDEKITPYADTVRRNFQNWIMAHHSGGGEKFNEEQMAWLRMIRDHIISSFHMERDDLDMAPFDAQGGMGRMHQLFGERMDDVIGELNEALAA